MIRVLEIKGGAYYSRNGVIDFIYYIGSGTGDATERVSRFLGIDEGSVSVVHNYSELK